MNWNTCLPTILVISMSGISSSQAAQSEQRQLDGVWTPVFLEVNGSKSPTDDIGSMKLVAKDDKLTLERNGEPVSVATLKLGTTKSPKSLDIQVVSGPNSGKKSLAIYKLEDDLLTVCWTLFAVNRDRPTEFATKPDSGLMLVRYRRQKESSKNSETAGDEKPGVVSAEADLANIQGNWELTFESNGKSIRTVKEIEGNKTKLTRYDEKGGVIHAHTSEFKLDVSGRVRIHTFFNLEVTAGEGKGQKVKGPHSYAYALYGDTWIEVQGLLVDQPDNDARLYRWTRLRD